MADSTNQVMPETLPHHSHEETENMAKTNAQLVASHEALTIHVDNLMNALNEALDTIEAQGQNIATLELETKRAHDRLDKARDVIRGMKETGAAKANTQAKRSTRQARKTTAPATRKLACNVPGNPHGDDEVTHTQPELNACWQAFYAAKA